MVDLSVPGGGIESLIRVFFGWNLAQVILFILKKKINEILFNLRMFCLKQPTLMWLQWQSLQGQSTHRQLSTSQENQQSTSLNIKEEFFEMFVNSIHLQITFCVDEFQPEKRWCHLMFPLGKRKLEALKFSDTKKNSNSHLRTRSESVLFLIPAPWQIIALLPP